MVRSKLEIEMTLQAPRIWPTSGWTSTLCTHRYINITLDFISIEHIYPAIRSMFSRVNQLARHFSRPLPNYLHNSAARSGISATSRLAMAQERSKRMISTAACLIIGDEVLGGKVNMPPNKNAPEPPEIT